jgi:peptidoglycan/LPS O-acetylase OafA/YrhL
MVAPDRTTPDALVDLTARSPNLDILRAIAATMVLLGHAYTLSGRAVIQLAGGSFLSTRWIIDALITFGYAGVWLFFALSGYLITKPFIRAIIAGEPLPALVPYGIRRAARIYPLYWVALTFTLLTLGTSIIGRRYLPALYLLVQNLVVGQQGAVLGVAWTLTLELLFYLLVPIAALIIVAVTRSKPVRPASLATMVAFVWVASTAFGELAAFTDSPTRQAWLRVVLPATLAMFCPGILLAIAEHDLTGSRWRWVLQEALYKVWAVPLAVVCLAAATMLNTGVLYGASGPDTQYFLLNDLARFLFAIGFGIVIARALHSQPWGGRLQRPLVEFGLISYGIYLIHFVIAQTLLLTDWGPDLIPLPRGGAVAYVVHVAYLLALTLPLAWLSWRFFERPILRWAIRTGDAFQARRRARAGAPAPARS